MGLRKRKPSRCNSVKKKKNSEENQDLRENPDKDSINNMENHEVSLLRLNNYVLLDIFQHLSPADLSSLSELRILRLTELTYGMREVNFSPWRKTNPELITSFFSKDRVKRIKKLNCNYFFNIKEKNLVKLICKCKDLTSLSVVECGLTYKSIADILRRCKKLEELAWSVNETVEELNVSCPKMKNIYLFCNDKKVTMNSLYYIVKNFHNIEKIWINFASDSISVLPFIGVWLRSSAASIELNRYCTIITNTLHFIDSSRELAFFSEIIRHEAEENRGILISDPVASRMYNCAPYLQIRTSEEDIEFLLSSGPFNAYTTISVVFTSEFDVVSEKLSNCIKETAGDKLKHLLLQNEEQHYDANGVHPTEMPDSEISLVCNFLGNIVQSSKYITALNLTTIHFKLESPFKAIIALKYLKVLDLPSCAFSKPINYSNRDDHIPLSTLVSSCPEVETFTLNCCLTDQAPIGNGHLIPLSKWKYLNHLSIYNNDLLYCSFLHDVADYCLKLQSLSLVSEKAGNSYIENVIYLLRKAKNLSFLRINDRDFNPAHERFWSSIAKAINLEGICINTSSVLAVNKVMILRGIKNLKYLHLFHFEAPKVPKCLYTEVKKSMQEHSIENIKVEKKCNTSFFNSLSKMQYYHKQPNFCCQHLHLQDMNIF